MIDYAAFAAADIRVGNIIAVEAFPEAHTPAFKLSIDFGPDIGIKHSSAQITQHYSPETLLNRHIIAVVNLAPRQIGPFLSEVLTLGVPDKQGTCVLIAPDTHVPLGAKLY